MKTKVIVAYSMSSTFVQTTLDYINSIKKYSNYDVCFVNVTHVDEEDLDIDQFDVIIHNYCSRLSIDNYVDNRYISKLKAFGGLKILSVQDEYENTNLLKANIIDLGFDIVLTCVPQDSIEYVYPSSEFQNVEFITVFTGYVPDDFAQSQPLVKPLCDRSITIGYRGRDIGGRYGRLGFDKFEIGRRMKEICDARHIATDIAMDEGSRIYGRAWFAFVGECRAMLGTESGSNVFDFDGSIAARFGEIAEANGGHRPSYAEFAPFIAQRDAEIDMGQISPRVFECALMRTPMILFRGRYSDAITAAEHYIALEKDFSNVDEVLKRLDDLEDLDALTRRAYDHLVGSGTFGYRAFIARLSNVIDDRLRTSRHRRTDASETDGAPPEWNARLLVDRPTAEPGRAEEFATRLAYRDARKFAAEVDHLDTALNERRTQCAAVLEEAAAIYRNQYNYLLRFIPAPDKALPTPSPASLTSRAGEWLSGTEKARAQHLEQRRVLAMALKEAVSAEDMVAASELAKDWRSAELNRYAAFPEIFSSFNERLVQERAAISEAHASLRRAAAEGSVQLPLKLRLQFWGIETRQRWNDNITIPAFRFAHRLARPAVAALVRRAPGMEARMRQLAARLRARNRLG